MIFNNIYDFIHVLPLGERIAGLDVGTKTIGVAVCDRDRNIASAKTTIRRKGNQKDIPLLLKMLDEYKVRGIVIGLPLTDDDKETETSRFIRRFADNLAKATDLPICFYDERLSSFEAKEFMIEDMGVKYQETRELVDQTAASFILQRFLERL